MGETSVNGEIAHSKALKRFESWPAVHDFFKFLKSNSYGQRSIALASDVYGRITKPLLPYLRRPYSYIKPCAKRIDELVDGGLSKIELMFPIVNESTSTAKKTVWNCALLPFVVANRSKDYVVGTFNNELGKASDGGNFGWAIAIVSTEMKIALDACQLVYQYWTQTKVAANTKAGEIDKSCPD